MYISFPQSPPVLYSPVASRARDCPIASVHRESLDRSTTGIALVLRSCARSRRSAPFAGDRTGIPRWSTADLWEWPTSEFANGDRSAPAASCSSPTSTRSPAELCESTSERDRPGRWAPGCTRCTCGAGCEDSWRFRWRWAIAGDVPERDRSAALSACPVRGARRRPAEIDWRRVGQERWNNVLRPETAEEERRGTIDREDRRWTIWRDSRCTTNIDRRTVDVFSAERELRFSPSRSDDRWRRECVDRLSASSPRDCWARQASCCSWNVVPSPPDRSERDLAVPDPCRSDAVSSLLSSSCDDRVWKRDRVHAVDPARARDGRVSPLRTDRSSSSPTLSERWKKSELHRWDRIEECLELDRCVWFQCEGCPPFPEERLQNEERLEGSYIITG